MTAGATKSICISLLGLLTLLSWAPAAQGAESEKTSVSSRGESSSGKEGMTPELDDEEFVEKSGFGTLSRIHWKPEYRRWGIVDATLTAGFGVSLIVSRVSGPPEGGPQGGIWFDESVRDALRAQSFQGRLLAADISDVLLGLSASYALLGDPLVNATWLRDSPDAGKQLFLINTEVLAVTLGLQQTVANAVGRERPYGRTCGTDELSEASHRCSGRDRYRSFFSGHTAVPFSMAAATCTHNLFLPLAGRRRDKIWIPCTVGFAMAATSGTMRIVSDFHYATDVITGALVGTTIGVSIPLIHYTTGTKPLSTEVGGVEMHFVPTGLGMQVMGVMP